MAVKKQAKAVDYIPDGLKSLAVPIASVKLWKDNPRKNDKAAEHLAGLIRLHGFRKPIMVDAQGIIRAGNTAYKAAKLLGMEKIPVVRQKFASTAAAAAYAISDNEAHEHAEWDKEVLAGLLKTESIAKGSGFSMREREMISVSGSAQVGFPVRGFARECAQSSLNILRYGRVKGGVLEMTNLDMFARVPVPEANDGAVSLEKIARGVALADAHEEADLGDFPAAPDVGKPLFTWNASEISGAAALRMALDESIISTRMLSFVFVDGNRGIAFVTDGHVAGWKTIAKFKGEIAIPCGAREMILGVIEASASHRIVVHEKWLDVCGVLFVKRPEDVRAPDLHKVVAEGKGPASEISVEKWKGALELLRPFWNRRTAMVMAEGGMLRAGGKQIPVDGAPAWRTAFSGIRMLDVLRALLGKVSVRWHAGMGPSIFGDCALLMPLRILDEDAAAKTYEDMEQAEDGDDPSIARVVLSGEKTATIRLRVSLGMGRSIDDALGILLPGAKKRTDGTWEYFGGAVRGRVE